MIEDNDYVAANALLEGNVQNLVKNASIAPNWLGDIGSFWYEREGEQGKEYRIVDTTSGESRTLADTADLVEAIGIDLAEENEPPPPGALPSNTGKYSLKALNHNLLLAEIETGMETQLTHDGEAYKSWGKLPDTGLMVIPAKKTGMQMPPIGTEFSPDDKFLVAALNDERNVSVMPFVEWVPTDGTLRPIVHEVRLIFKPSAHSGVFTSNRVIVSRSNCPKISGSAVSMAMCLAGVSSAGRHSLSPAPSAANDYPCSVQI